MRRLTPALAAMALVVSVSACSDGGDVVEPEPTPTTSEEPPAEADVCSLLDPTLLQEVTPAGDTPRTVLGYGSEYLASCSVDGNVSFEFGVQIGPEAYQQLPDTSDTVTEVPDLGDRSVLDENPPGLSATLFTERDGVQFRIRNETLSNPDGIDTDTMVEVMRSLLENADAATVEGIERVALGSACPAADAPEITTLTGPVVTARGGFAVGDGVSDCQYLGEGGTRVSLSFLAQAGAEEDFVQADPDAGIEETTLDGAESAVLASGSGVNLTWATSPDLVWFLDASPLVGSPDYDGDTTPALEEVTALAQAYMALEPEAAG